MLKLGLIFVLLVSAQAAEEECVERPFACYTYEWLTAKGLPHDRPAAFEKKCTPCPLAPCTNPETFAAKGVFWPKVICNPTGFFCVEFPTEGNVALPNCTKPIALEGKKKYALLPFNFCHREMLAKGTCPVELLSREPYRQDAVKIAPGFFVQCDAGFMVPSEGSVPAELKKISNAVPVKCVNACVYKEKGTAADYAECQLLDVVDRQNETDIKVVLKYGKRQLREAEPPECISRPFFCYAYEWLAEKQLPHDAPASGVLLLVLGIAALVWVVYSRRRGASKQERVKPLSESAYGPEVDSSRVEESGARV
ncbi:unnamed protein product, partial [Mesorhabditis spiculigera]